MCIFNRVQSSYVGQVTLFPVPTSFLRTTINGGTEYDSIFFHRKLTNPPAECARNHVSDLPPEI